MAATTQRIDQARLDEFMGRFVGDLGAAVSAALVVIGDRLGLYRAMADGEPVTPDELAQRSGTDARYVREWLSNQAAGGYVTYDARQAAFSLSPEQSFALAQEGSPAFVPGAFQLATAAIKDEPKITEAFRTGEGVGWHEHHHDLFAGTERFFRPGYVANLVSSWIPALDGVQSKLEAGALVADVGCGHGASTILMAKAFPRSKFVGFDYHEESIEHARGGAAEAGVGDRVSFEVAAAKDYPGDGLRPGRDVRLPARHGRSGRRRRARARDARGRRHLDDRRAVRGDRLEDNLNPVGRVFYGASTMICTPASRDPGGRARARRSGRRGAAARGRDRGRLHTLPARHRDAVQPGARSAPVGLGPLARPRDQSRNSSVKKRSRAAEALGRRTGSASS